MLPPWRAEAPLTVHTALTSWQFAPIVTAGVGFAALAYFASVAQLRRRRGKRWPLRCSFVFVAGLAAIAIATQSSIGTYDDVLFSVHMVQHLLLIMVAPPLLVLGRPVTLGLQAWGNPLHRWLLRVVRSKPLTALTYPPVAVALYVVVVAVTHLTPLMNVVVENDAVHQAEHALYLVVGYLFFLPLLGCEPIRWRLSMPARYGVLLVVMPIDIAIGVALMLAPHELFSAYLHDGRTWGPSPVADLNLGGTIMWMGGETLMVPYVLYFALAFVRDGKFGDQLGSWLERRRSRALISGLLDAGMLPALSRRERSIDTLANLESYNAYLTALGTREVGEAAAPGGPPHRG
jgi:cytochrome c oxidase assembly factor CtaG